MKINKIAILIAMEAEARPLIESLELNEYEFPMFSEGVHLWDKMPFKAYRKGNVTLTIAGKDRDHQVDNVGTVPATLMTYLAIESFNPDIIINAGTAGGFECEGCKIGDVYLSKKFIFHDRRIPISGFREYGIGSYPSYDTSEMAKKLNLKTGIISTGDSLDNTFDDLDIMTCNGADIKDMESAAIAWVCKTMNVPMFAIKSITDLIDIKKPTPEQFKENLSIASENLCKSVVEVVKYFGKDEK